MVSARLCGATSRGVRSTRAFRLAIVLCLAASIYHLTNHKGAQLPSSLPQHIAIAVEKCRLLDVQPGHPPDFHSRTQSDRFVEGTKPTLITNATIWTVGDDGRQVVHGDILLDRGLIKQIGRVTIDLTSQVHDRIDAQGKWVTPGVIDMHSHLGVYSALPVLMGTLDGNSYKGPIIPWLRTLDALNTHDDAYRLSVAGGVTTSLILPGSGNAIGGQSVVIKLRPTAGRSPTSMLLENPYEADSSVYNRSSHVRYRYIKHACGENPGEWYSGTRMDTMWALREAYDKARTIKQAQDDYCTVVRSGKWDELGAFPDDLQWESLVDVLRGRAKVHAHCYETVDLDDLVRLSNEFKFSIAAFHHAAETYLSPGTLRSAYGAPPAVALFARQGRFKREAYRASEFAPRILAQEGFKVVLKSDHPVLDSRFLLWEAQQAHYYGLPENVAIAAVTSSPAEVLGLDHRVGFIKEGHDADVVLWDSHPLALGATPQQVWIDGVLQLIDPRILTKPSTMQRAPMVPDFDREAEETLKYDGLPPLEPRLRTSGTVVFANVSSVYTRASGSIKRIFPSTSSSVDLRQEHNMRVWVVVRSGEIFCIGARQDTCVTDALSLSDEPLEIVDLEGGALTPGLTTYGSELGLDELQSERETSTKDGTAPNGLTSGVPPLAGGAGGLIRAEDGLMFGTRVALLAYREGVTTGVIAPQSGGFLQGLSTAFSLGAAHKLEKGAIVQTGGAVHISIHPVGKPSVSTQIAALRRLLLRQTSGEPGRWFEKVRKGEAPLVVNVHNADIMATLIELKVEVERELNLRNPMRFTFAGAQEAHLLANELAEAGVGVILTYSRPFPLWWEMRRILPGPPLSQSAIEKLLAHGVIVGLGTPLADKAASTRFDAAWSFLESNGSISDVQAIELVSTNMEKLLGVGDVGELVATRGGVLLGFSKVVGVLSSRREIVDIL